ncbi:MAG: LptA/OstA family protein [Rickettsiales bacterium]
MLKNFFNCKVFIKLFCVIVIVLLWQNLQISNSFANNNSKKNKSQIKIKADIFDIKQNSQKIDLINNVIVEKDDISLLSDKMVILYHNTEKKDLNNSSKIKEIKALSNVKMFNNEFVASSETGIYDPKKNIFILQKNVIVNSGTSIASGEEFIYDLNLKKGFFSGNKKTVPNSLSQDKIDDRVTVIIGSDINDQIKNFKKD